ncbi:DNA polymerase III subunit delta [Sphingomonas baiyangensis]|uniref:DNA-directed DNA polymerase n=1 Tax=Sphingomonas baiyangensis TaxID=2572576 RepID=A0A4U1L6M0_9SPHN|nr:DNA polymerase III subunit delta [Sphingomonas baiyangensis]TKD51935.1 DNA polymerase III subunit delta [Sphingomonas baiyangensis]
MAAPDATTRLYLLHGADEAGALALAAVLAEAMGADAERIDLDGPALAAQPGRLADEAATLSLFGTPRHIRIANTGEESLEALTLLLDAPRAGNPVVAIAPSVRTKAKIVKLAEDAGDAVACACYPPEGDDLVRLVIGMARDAGLRTNAAAAEQLIAVSGGDRGILSGEIAKLALYLDAAPDRPADLEADAIDAVGATLDESALFDVIDYIVAGDLAKVARDLPGVIADVTPSPVLRQLARRLLTLAEIRRDIDAGGPPAKILERHRIFWKQQAATLELLRRWDQRRLAQVIARLPAIERQVFGAGSAGHALAETELLAIARSAARRR